MENIHIIPPLLWIGLELYMYYKRRFTISDIQNYLATVTIHANEKQRLADVLNKSMNPMTLLELVFTTIPVLVFGDKSKFTKPKFLQDKKILSYIIKLMQGTSITLFSVIMLEILLVFIVVFLTELVTFAFTSSYDIIANLKARTEVALNRTVQKIIQV